MEKTITLTLEQAQKIYKEGEKDIKKLLLTTFTEDELENNYPKTWKECFKSYDRVYYINALSEILSSNILCSDSSSLNSLPSRETAKKILIICQLLICRDVYRNGWDCSTGGYCVYFDDGKIEVLFSPDPDYYMLSFPTRKVADEFVKNFGHLITAKIKEFL